MKAVKTQTSITWRELANNMRREERSERKVWIDRVNKKKWIQKELPLKSINGVFQSELLCVCSKRAVWCEGSSWEREGRETEKQREAGTWKTCLFLSSSQLGLWKSGEAQCEVLFCWRSVPFLLSFSLLWAYGFLITASLNQCLFPCSIFWWIKAIILVGSGQFPSGAFFDCNSTLCVCHFPHFRSCSEFSLSVGLLNEGFTGTMSVCELGPLPGWNANGKTRTWETRVPLSTRTWKDGAVGKMKLRTK